MASRTRRELVEKYTFLRQAGWGTYGTTWIAEDKTTGEPVAIKVISKAKTSRADFKRELKYSKVYPDMQTSSLHMTLPMIPSPLMSWCRILLLVGTS